jgi:tetratricopeptide (TPR) repeat protein
MEENFGGGRFRWWHAAAAIAGFATLAVVGYLVGDGSNRGQPEPGPTKGRGGRKGKSASLRSSSSSVKSQSPPRSPAHLGQQPGLPADSKRREVQMALQQMIMQIDAAMKTGDMHLGEILAKQAYNYCKQTVGVDDEFSGIVLGVLFDILTTQGKWRDASDLLEEAVDVVARSAPNTNGHAALLSNLTSLYINQNRMEEAERIAEESFVIADRIFDALESKDLFIKIANELAIIKRELKKFSEAESLMKAVLPVMVRENSEDIRLLEANIRLFNLLLEQGKYEEARKHLDVSLEAIQSITDIPEDRRTILTVPLLIAECGYFLNQGDFESAEATLKKSKEMSKGQSLEVGQTYELVNLYYRLGREEEAKALEEETKTLVKNFMEKYNRVVRPYYNGIHLHSTSISLSTKPASEYRLKLRSNKLKETHTVNGQSTRIPALKTGNYIEVNFENPAQREAFIVQAHEVTETDREITFNLPVEGVTLGEWYTIWIDVYENNEKANKLSYGKQIVLAEEEHPQPDDY